MLCSSHKLFATSGKTPIDFSSISLSVHVHVLLSHIWWSGVPPSSILPAERDGGHCGMQQEFESPEIGKGLREIVCLDLKCKITSHPGRSIHNN
jgi:hypothetical protein